VSHCFPVFLDFASDVSVSLVSRILHPTSLSLSSFYLQSSRRTNTIKQQEEIRLIDPTFFPTRHS
jgi:hypothetical protein